DPENSQVVGMVGISALPTGGADQKSYSTLGGWQVMVSSYSEHKEEAIAFAKFRAGEYAQTLMAKKLSHTPSLKALYQDEDRY
ncbi:Bacterial extracellular solute-binding protein like protein, partial [Aduncisulcus paluster]